MAKRKVRVRYFELRDGNNKCVEEWQITLKGASYSIRHRKPGSKARTSTKRFGSAAEAKAAANQLMLAKHADGYVYLAPCPGANLLLDGILTPNNTRRFVDMARDGDVDAIWSFADCDPSSNADVEVYLWLSAAEDFGHQAATECIADVLELTSLRYDDDGYCQGEAHWELARAYLLGGVDGLNRNLELARKHLGLACEAVGAGHLAPTGADVDSLHGLLETLKDEMLPS